MITFRDCFEIYRWNCYGLFLMQNEANFLRIAELSFKISTKLCAKRGYKKIIAIFQNSLLMHKI